MNLLLAASLLFAVSGMKSLEEPFMMIRFGWGQTKDEATWKPMFEALKANRPACDEVWFGTVMGYCPLSRHAEIAAVQAKAAADCRSAGILPGLQLHESLGHGDMIHARNDNSARNWRGFTGPTGIECRICSCPRAPAFIAYEKAVVRIYAAAYRPSSIWIDDDFRMDNHEPACHYSRPVTPGCYCPECLAAFAKTEGRPLTREALVEGMRTDAALKARWLDFSYGALVELAREIARAVHEVSPETRMGLQHSCVDLDRKRAIFRALEEATGLKAMSRCGGGGYYDADPNALVSKASLVAHQLEALADEPALGQVCPEVENCPRTMSCKTPRGTVLESFLHLAVGANALSYFVSGLYETPEFYRDGMFRRLADNAPFLREYARANEGTIPSGLHFSGMYVDSRWSRGPLPAFTGWMERRGEVITTARAGTISADELDAALAQGALLGGGAVRELIRRGFAAKLGGLQIGNVAMSASERLTDDPVNRGFAGMTVPAVAEGTTQDRWEVTAMPSGDVRVLGTINSGEKDRPSSLLVALPDGKRYALLGVAAFDFNVAPSHRLVQIGRVCDWVSRGRLDAFVETPAVCHLFPRVSRTDGTLVSVAVLNPTIDDMPVTRFRLRHVPAGMAKAVWHVLGGKDVRRLPLVADGDDRLVTVDGLSPWNAGYLTFAM